MPGGGRAPKARGAGGGVWLCVWVCVRGGVCVWRRPCMVGGGELRGVGFSG